MGRALSNLGEGCDEQEGVINSIRIHSMLFMCRCVQ